MKRKEIVILTIVRILLILGTLFSLWFIFSNATATGTASSNQSATVTDKVQDVVGSINPSSPIANATGRDYDLLHVVIRDLAHFAQYMMLGAFGFGTYLSFKGKGNWGCFFIPVGSLFITAATDEYVQTLTDGRGAQLSDLNVDVAGGVCGCLVALVVFALVCITISAVRRRRG
jgi:VanZ family protein